MTATPLDLLLADDDTDDCIFFQEALAELPFSPLLTIVHDGVQLMQLLSEKETLPHALFLDLNMPRKGGTECLSEIKLNDKLKKLPVIIFSTSLNLDVVDLLYRKGAHYYIRKPGEFDALKKVIFEVVRLLSKTQLTQPSRSEFVFQP